MNFFHKALGLAGGIFLISAAYGMDPDRAMSQYVHDRWGVEQGFPPGPVYAIAQSGDGYLWIGTGAGLVRFDGWNFRLIKDDSGAFTIGSVLGLVPDDDGYLWVRLQDFSLVRYRNGVFDRPSSDVQGYNQIDAMTRASHGELLVSRMQIGAFAFRSGAFQLLAANGGLPKSPVTAMAQTQNSDLWLGTRDAGLFRFSGGQMSSIRKGLPDLKVDSLLSGEGKDVWVGTDEGVVRWNGKEIVPSGIPPAFGRFQALLMVRDRDGNLWIGTDSRGLLRVNSRGVASLGTGAEAAKRAITALFEDREGDLWIGHTDGIERLRDSAFVTYSAAEGLPTDGGNPVYVDSERRMWFPPVEGGLWWAKGAQHERVTNDGLSRDVVYSIDGDGKELWVGRQRGGLTQLHVEQGSITAKTYTEADGLAQNSVYSVALSHDGTVWAGTLSAGVSMLRDGKFTSFTVANGLASNTVASILEGADGNMWFSTPSGLSILSKGQWRTYTVADGLPSENVNCLLEDASGVLWVGTASGIAFRDAGAFKVPVGLPAALRGQVLGLAEDRFGWLWIGTSSNVLRVNREKLWRGALSEGDIREYGLADGLRGTEGVKRHRSVIADSAGRIWFSLNVGISVADPARLIRNSAPAIVHVQSVTADGDPIHLGNDVQVPGSRKRITFRYSGLSLSIPEQVRYRYWLEGFDRGWSESTATREAVYTNLPPRRYRFRVMATNADGQWSSNEDTVTFDVEPLLWQTWWFGLSALILCAGCILVLYRIRLRHATRQINLRFQERLAERTRIAQELHDTLLQGFLSASIQVHVAADSLPADSSVKPTLNRALELMRQVIDEGRNAVRGLRSSNSASLDLEQAFLQIQQELVHGEETTEKVSFRVIVDGEQRPLHPVLRDEVYRIGREALTNAFRHARARKIEIELRYATNRFCILVRDDGCGIDPHVLQTGRDGHWGLSGMRERADRIGARLHVMSSAFAGTEVELSVPGSVAFQSKPDGSLRWFQNGKGR